MQGDLILLDLLHAMKNINTFSILQGAIIHKHINLSVL